MSATKPIPGPFHIEATDYQSTAFIANADGETVGRLLDEPLAEFFVAAPDMAEALRQVDIAIQRACADIAADIESGWVPKPGTVGRTAIRVRQNLEQAARIARAALARAGL